jgi:hypothetical protein
MNVGMRDALADSIVHRDEAPFCPERDLHRATQALRETEHRNQLAGGQVDDGLAMSAWNDQNVAHEERARIEECDACIVLGHAMCGDLPGGDCAERAYARQHRRALAYFGSWLRGSVDHLMRTVVAAPALLLLSASTVHASDAFEIQVYDGTANPVGAPGVELHLNEWATGHRDADAPEAPLHGQFHATIEPSFGVMPWWELGAYFQSAVRTDDGMVDWAGAKLRSKFVTPPGWNAHLRLGANVELSYVPATYERDVWGAEVRPIVAWQNRDWLFAINPILEQALAGSGASDGPSFQPAAKASRAWGVVAFGLEYYGTFGPVFSPLPLRQEEHYLYEIFDLIGVAHFELNVGLGEGLTPASAGIVMKAIVGYTFESPTTQTRSARACRVAQVCPPIRGRNDEGHRSSTPEIPQSAPLVQDE